MVETSRRWLLAPIWLRIFSAALLVYVIHPTFLASPRSLASDRMAFICPISQWVLPAPGPAKTFMQVAKSCTSSECMNPSILSPILLLLLCMMEH